MRPAVALHIHGRSMYRGSLPVSWGAIAPASDRSRHSDPMPTRLKPKGLDPSHRLTVGLGEYDTRWHDPVRSLARARNCATGPRRRCWPSCSPGDVRKRVHHRRGQIRRGADGRSSLALSALAAEHHLWLIAGLSMRRNGQYLNSALAFAPDGRSSRPMTSRGSSDMRRRRQSILPGRVPV